MTIREKVLTKAKVRKLIAHAAEQSINENINSFKEYSQLNISFEKVDWYYSDLFSQQSHLYQI